MKPGDKVVCVEDFKKWLRPNEQHIQLPKVGDIYTVRYVYERHIVSIYLIEIVNSKDYYRDGFLEPGFDINGFRPVDYTYGTEVCEKLEKELSETLIPESV